MGQINMISLFGMIDVLFVQVLFMFPTLSTVFIDIVELFLIDEDKL